MPRNDTNKKPGTGTFQPTGTHQYNYIIFDCYTLDGFLIL